jgi:nucleoside-diphosphate-sugar epimerase
MGRSAIEYISSISPSLDKNRLLLIGSKTSSLKMNDIIFEIENPRSGFSLINERAIFFNAAFLRREYLHKIPSSDYVAKNTEISLVAKNVIKRKKLISFINLSSGVAREYDNQVLPESINEYSRLKKKFEIEYSDFCNETGTPIVNCRIFSLSGKHLNEFENLALSSFVRQAKLTNHIQVKSPKTKRTYVDAIELAKTLLIFAISGEGANLDSGGVLVTMLDLAEEVAKIVGSKDCEILKGNENSADYFGDYEDFNKLALATGQSLSGIEKQILNTVEAFRF